jgi:hypothetical protein
MYKINRDSRTLIKQVKAVLPKKIAIFLSSNKLPAMR